MADRAYDSHISGFNNPWGVTVDSSDNVWVSDPGNGGKIFKYDAYPSQTLESIQTGSGHYEATYILSLAIDHANGNLYVADSGPVTVDVFNPVEFLEQWQIGGGYDYVATDNSGGSADGRIYVAQARGGVIAFDKNHQPATLECSSCSYVNANTITGTPSGNFGELWNIAVDAEGNIYVVDKSKEQVDEFKSSGEFVQSFTGAGAPDGFVGELTGVAVDPTDGNVLIVDNGNQVVDEFDSSRTYVGEITGSGPEEENAFGTLNGGVAVNSNGYVYLADSAAGSVDIFTPNAILPKVTYGAATNQTQTSGTLNASVNLNGGPEVTSCVIQYGLTGGYGSTVPCAPATPYSGTTAISANLSGLTTEATYHYRVVLTTENGTAKASDHTYIPHAVAGLTTDPASNVARNCATLNGSFNGDGEDTHVHFEWGATSSYGQSTPIEDAGSDLGAQSESFELCGLQAQTTYHYRIVASNAAGNSSGLDQSFETLVAVENLSTEPATGVTASTATLNGVFAGIGEDVHYYFEWGLGTSYGRVTSVPPGNDAGSPSGSHAVNQELVNLQPDTTYHYRVVAIDAAGTSFGADRSFATAGRYALSGDFGSAGTGDGQLAHPQDVAVDNSTGDTYVADTGNHRIVKFDSAGDFVSAWGWGVNDGQASSEVCTGGCRAGAAGRGAGQFTTPSFVEVDNSGGPSAGDVYVADTADGVVQKFDSSGQLVATWGSDGAIAFSNGTIGGISVDTAGNLFVVTDNSPYLWTEVGQDGVSRTSRETGSCCNTDLGTPGGAGIEVGADGAWYELQAPGGGVIYSSPIAAIYVASQLYATPSPVDSGIVIDRPTNDVYIDQGTYIDQFSGIAGCGHEVAQERGCSPSDSFGSGDLNGSAGLAFQPSSGLLYAANSGDNNIAVFSPLPVATTTTGPITDPTSTSGTLTGQVNPQGGQLSDCHFELLSESASTNQIQNVTVSGATSGTFTLSFRGVSTAPIAVGENGSGVRFALESLSTVGPGNVAVSGTEGGPYRVEFKGSLANSGLPLLAEDSSSLVPPTATVSVAPNQGGGDWSAASLIPCEEPDAAEIPGDEAPHAVHATANDLTPFTTYRYRLVAVRADGDGFPSIGNARTYTPSHGVLPGVDATDSAGITQTSAQLSASINPNSAPTTYRFQYGTEASYGSQTLPSESIGEDDVDHSVHAEVSGLTPGTTYHYRVLATNFSGSTAGPDQTFTTPDLPTVGESPASDISATTAILNASVRPGFRATTYHFDYGPTPAYGVSTGESAALGSDDSAHLASAVLGGLAPATTYHYRVVATNAIGSAQGPDQVFTTASASPVKSLEKPAKCAKGLIRVHGKCVKKKKNGHGRKGKHSERSHSHG